MARAQSGHDESLLGFSWRGFFDHLRHVVKPPASGDQVSADRAIIRRLALVSRLDGRNRAILCGSDLDQLLRRTLWPAADVKVIAHQQQKGLSAHQLTPT